MCGSSPGEGRLPPVPTAVAGLCALALAVFLQVRNHGFVNLDDAEYVYRNRKVLAGLTWDGVYWAFSGFRVSNWHPLTWISHMLHVELFGASPGPHHLVSMTLHLANTLVLFLFFRNATGAVWRSAAVAAAPLPAG